MMNTLGLSRNKRSTSFRLLYYWTKFLGLNPLSITKNGDFEFTYIGLFYGLFLSLIYLYVFFNVAKDRPRAVLPGETPASLVADLIAVACHFLQCSSTIIICSIFQNHTIVVINSFVRAEKLSVKLGIPENNEIFFNEIARNLTIFNIAYVLSLTFSHAMWYHFASLELKKMLPFLLMSLSSHNMIIVFVWSLIFIKRKFRLLNAKVEFLITKEPAMSVQGPMRSSSYEFDLLSERISRISQLHRELRDVIYRIEKQFGFPILFTIGNNFSYVTFVIYSYYRYLKSSDPSETATNCMYLLALGHWIMYPIIAISTVSHICGSTVDEANKTSNLLHNMINNCKIPDVRRKNSRLNILSLDLLQNRLTISMFGLLELDHFLIYRVLATVATYLTVMLQFYS